MSRYIGQHYERFATRFLQKQHVRILYKNYTCKLGEIDLIGCQGQLLIFFEVKYRTHSEYGSSIEMVAFSKQLKLQKTAEHFLMQYPAYQSFNCRFDLLAIESTPRFVMHWIENII